MKKRICLICAGLLVLSLASCGKAAPTLYDRGMEVISLMEDAVRSEVYLDLMSAAQPLREQIAQAAEGDYTTPKAVYAISFPGHALQLFSGSADSADLPETLTDVVGHRLLAAVVSQVNAAGGMEALAASAICTIGKTFVSTELTEDLIYLYIFESGNPIAVTFTGGEDHTVSATANMILNEDFPCRDAEEIADFFGGEAVEVQTITERP